MNPRRAAAMVLIGATSLLAGGCSAGGSHPSTQSAADFVRRVTTEFSRGQSGRLWDELLVGDQRIVTRSQFVACQANEGWNLKSLRVLETYADPVQADGKTLPSTAVSVRVTSDDGVTTATMHAVSVNGAWRWVLQPTDRNAYKKGTCPRTA